MDIQVGFFMDINILTDDNVELRATLYKAANPKAVVLINPGTATNTSYYLPFAKYLREHGFHVILWNYRGFCDSKVSHLKDCHYPLHTTKKTKKSVKAKA
ncbi:serine aminopeptidase domain-containing protein [Psychrobacter sanguinis]|uniref:serine aminopeptidase domain-containing protein n=1 Tax=Psychrobacter sanguinis TaxID=861445 RepID=UPI001D1052AF|nr:alpha/beta hydrolase [Psychrobacter sanguinis]UEC27042.1 alpha/beta hydrolase [Psychrobacter sanguinis]